jgi:Lipase (class 3)
LIYSSVPIGGLLEHIDTLTRPDFPLEHHNALKGATLVDFFYGSVAKLPVAILHRPSQNQVVIAIAGTTQIQHIAQDLRFLKTKHPSGKGSLHSGFWALFSGIEDQVKTSLRKALEAYKPSEVVVTGHSMGGAVAYLLSAELLSEQELPPLPTLKLITFGSPRVGDEAFATHFRGLVGAYQAKHGGDSFIDYAVRGFNDGKILRYIPDQFLREKPSPQVSRLCRH